MSKQDILTYFEKLADEDGFPPKHTRIESYNTIIATGIVALREFSAPAGMPTWIDLIVMYEGIQNRHDELTHSQIKDIILRLVVQSGNLLLQLEARDSQLDSKEQLIAGIVAAAAEKVDLDGKAKSN